ncbi:uncharacterized protein LOC117007574 [Catharus ustulatus]|uniref:uncharacterized protein LOC117007574 n=1 Tax=Catharus ustulatus TaxID=91951 RepID=UPI001408CED2|nr:uncharacterized protein LOC117007574 [Catharus ustulatus]
MKRSKPFKKTRPPTSKCSLNIQGLPLGLEFLWDPPWGRRKFPLGILQGMGSALQPWEGTIPCLLQRLPGHPGAWERDLCPLERDLCPLGRDLCLWRGSVSFGEGSVSFGQGSVSFGWGSVPFGQDLCPLERDLCPLERDLCPLDRDLCPLERDLCPSKDESSAGFWNRALGRFWGAQGSPGEAAGQGEWKRGTGIPVDHPSSSGIPMDHPSNFGIPVDHPSSPGIPLDHLSSPRIPLDSPGSLWIICPAPGSLWIISPAPGSLWIPLDPSGSSLQPQDPLPWAQIPKGAGLGVSHPDHGLLFVPQGNQNKTKLK